MCLDSIRKPRFSKRRKTITVYKLLLFDPDSDRFLSFIRLHPWWLNDIQYSTRKSVDWTLTERLTTKIEKGFHFYRSLKDAFFAGIYNSDFDIFAVVECCVQTRDVVAVGKVVSVFYSYGPVDSLVAINCKPVRVRMFISKRPDLPCVPGTYRTVPYVQLPDLIRYLPAAFCELSRYKLHKVLSGWFKKIHPRLKDRTGKTFVFNYKDELCKYNSGINNRKRK